MKPLLVVLSSFLLLVSSFAADTAKPNVLFIAVDDLNHWIGHFGRNKQTKTPNIDRLAAMGVSFTNAQCAAPVCNPSRAALLSGKRPGTTGIYDNNNPFTQVLKPEVSLVMQFKKAGYDTLGTGKLWHGGLGWPEQWTTIKEETVQKGSVSDRSIAGIAFGPIVEGGDEAVSDTSIADFGISELSKPHEKPFFLTLGFHKPHMPWNVPQKYYDMHPLAEIQLPPTQEDDLSDIPAAGIKMAKPSGDHAAVLAELERIGQRPDHGLLPDQVLEPGRPVFPRQHLIDSRTKRYIIPEHGRGHRVAGFRNIVLRPVFGRFRGLLACHGLYMAQPARNRQLADGNPRNLLWNDESG